MTFIKGYLIPRLIQYFLVIFVGVTAVFFIPRFLPSDPVTRTIAQLQSRGSYLDPDSIDEMIQDFNGTVWALEGSMLDQYGNFLGETISGRFWCFILSVSYTGDRSNCNGRIPGLWGCY